MANDFFKGLGRYIPPEIRRFSPAIKTVADIIRPTKIVNNPAVSNLIRSPSVANLGNVLSNTAKKSIVGNLISSVPSLIANIVSQASGSSARQLAILNARKTLGTDQVALNKFNTDLKSKGL